MDNIKKLELVPAEDLLKELKLRTKHPIKDDGTRSPESNPTLREFDEVSIARALKANQKVIYGTDDRLDIFDLSPGPNLDDVDSVVALFNRSDIIDNGNGTSTLQTRNFGTAQNLCPGERFREQPIGAFCSGFLVAPDVIATAGHCVNTSNAANVCFVFGFRMQNATTATTTIENKDIYRGASVIGRQEVSNGPDWALVRLDRPVNNHRVVKFRRAGTIPNGQAVHVIGHPVGLPTKFAGGATVRENQSNAFFIANLDTYGGNSGSPVFNSTTHEVEGILVRGEADFVAQGTCNISLVCPTTGCRGEDCTRTTEFAPLVRVPGSWEARHGLTSAQYQQVFNELAGQGFRLTNVSGYAVGGQDLYAAIWEQREGPAWQARHGLTSAQYQQVFNELPGQGFRLTNVSGYAVGGQDLYAAIWEQREGPAWQARHGLTSTQYQQAFDELAGQGFRLTDVSGYAVGGQDLYAAIWEQREGPAWQARHGLTSAQYQQVFNELAGQGFRLTNVSGYAVGGQDLYAAIWEQREGPAWQARHGLTSTQYQQAFDELARQGFRLTDVSGYAVGNQDLYAALWEKIEN
ncbi:trypsin-like peptidase domain-containing protein [Azotobacter chroococcum]|uniref:trypsin-like peptidase domain-containing protein n=1 Tax=Azotobacter chroococcum TaxID=353 RepID=UPI001A955DE7|nr:trypsin-like peptidase domain-containing protein [Azotobacter chroococcum]